MSVIQEYFPYHFLPVQDRFPDHGRTTRYVIFLRRAYTSAAIMKIFNGIDAVYRYFRKNVKHRLEYLIEEQSKKLFYSHLPNLTAKQKRQLYLLALKYAIDNNAMRIYEMSFQMEITHEIYLKEMIMVADPKLYKQLNLNDL